MVQKLSRHELKQARAAYGDYHSAFYEFFNRHNIFLTKQRLNFETFIDVLPEAFWSGEQQIIQWYRIVQAAEGIVRMPHFQNSVANRRVSRC
jgi:hypothetical protein